MIIVTLESGSPRVRVSFTTTNINGSNSRRVAFLPSAVAPSPTIVTIFGQTLSVWDVRGEVATRLGAWETSASIRGWAVTPSGEIALLRASGALQFIRHEAFLSGADPEPLSIIPNVLPLGIGATLRFSAYGRIMSVVRVDGKVDLWDIEKRASIGSNFAWPTASAAFPSPDGKSLLVTNDTATILWDLRTGEWPDKVCSVAGRNLTEAEWAKYFPGRTYAVTCDQWAAKPKY
jgi:WD40 repeat protein